MVKNVNGGNRGKAVARKNVKVYSKHSLRIPTDEMEHIGFVSKMLGNGQCTIQMNDGKMLLGQIRNKMRGRNKRSNIVNPGAIVMIGLHDWEAPNFKKCDILEVYDDYEVNQLIEIPQVDISELVRLQRTNGMFSATDIDNASHVVFSVGDSDIVLDSEVEMTKSGGSGVTVGGVSNEDTGVKSSSVFMVDNEVINIDDI